MDNFSKTIKKIDDSSKKMQMQCLKGDEGHGFDIDTVYFYNNKWYIFEYLKCENDYVTPFTSEPSRYPWNWKKFHSLFQIAKQLKGELVLINYADKEYEKNQVRVMMVDSIDYKILEKYIETPYEHRPKHLDYIIYKKIINMSLDDYSKWLRELNKESEIYPLG